ncbi:hypothetical protein GWI33_007719 [Rhynchophorus ferrugineus]|uniref:Uncharacterized protein n=1 Tax=Rhynchophorus ferrugineus TaxID=354439 RepID=A0A834ISP9_RHYFE|nr:hypothetical protein GWI33_007719 [Rhynchophorus ferrugineus]
MYDNKELSLIFKVMKQKNNKRTKSVDKTKKRANQNRRSLLTFRSEKRRKNYAKRTKLMFGSEKFRKTCNPPNECHQLFRLGLGNGTATGQRERPIEWKLLMPYQIPTP